MSACSVYYAFLRDILYVRKDVIVTAKKGRKTKRWPVVLLYSISFVLLAVGVSVPIGGAWIARRYKQSLPEEYLLGASGNIAPTFYAYAFSDRANREGEKHALDASFFGEEPTPLLEQTEIPKALEDAFIAIEDKRFYRHRGVDWLRTGAAALTYLTKGSSSFGGSTITQQLVKNLTGNKESTPERKLREIFYALDLESRLDKREILTLYLNVIHFSDGCDGVAAAAEHYFSKSVGELTVEECASIAAITNSPTYYNPVKNPTHNVYRRNLILTSMREQGFLGEHEYLAASARPLVLSVKELAGGIRSWYAEMVTEDIVRDLCDAWELDRATAWRWLSSGGLSVDVAMDAELQAFVEDYYRNAITLPHRENGERAQSALILMDTRTGDILAVAGGAGEKKGNRVQNFATDTRRSPGSCLKPISVYAPALAEGLITWSTVYDDVPVDFGPDGRTPWPQNAGRTYRGLTDVAYAIAHSTNTVSVRVLDRLGLDRSFAYAKERFGLNSLSERDRTRAGMALGQLDGGVTLRELTAAYIPFADGGIYHAPKSYYRVTDREGRVLLACPDTGRAVLSEANAAVMTKLLEGVIERGTASSLTLPGTGACAGKTGSSGNDHDRLFVGYTPDYVCGVWCGYEYPAPLTGKNPSLAVFDTVMKETLEKRGGRTAFSIPSTVLPLTYCRDSGELLSESCLHDARGDRKETGWFEVGSEPHTFCSRHVLCDYDGAEGGGVSHGACDGTHKVALVRVERSFSSEVYVADAEYSYFGEPATMPPCDDPSKPYFWRRDAHTGISSTPRAFNRSCTRHKEGSTPLVPWEFLPPAS